MDRFGVEEWVDFLAAGLRAVVFRTAGFGVDEATEEAFGAAGLRAVVFRTAGFGVDEALDTEETDFLAAGFRVDVTFLQRETLW